MIKDEEEDIMIKAEKEIMIKEKEEDIMIKKEYITIKEKEQEIMIKEKEEEIMIKKEDIMIKEEEIMIKEKEEEIVIKKENIMIKEEEEDIIDVVGLDSADVYETSSKKKKARGQIKPASKSVKKTSTSVFKKPSVPAAKKPSTSVFKIPSIPAVKKPSTSSAKKSNTSVFKAPGTGAVKSSSAVKTPSAFKTPSTSAIKTPGTSAVKASSISAVKKPSVVVKSGKSRRNIFKNKNPFRAPRSISIPISSDRIPFRGSFFTKGDIVSVVDAEARVYYAQIRGLLQDQYGEKSAVITWLLPTRGSPIGRFDPSTYILGPEEDIPRTLDCLEFVCHSPSEYFKVKNPTHPEIPEKPVCGYAWTSKGPKIVPLPAEDFSSDSD